MVFVALPLRRCGLATRPTAESAPGFRSIHTTMRSSRPASSTPWSTRSANRPRSEEICTARLYNRPARRLSPILRKIFSFLSTRNSAEEQVVSYITREHRRGRRLAEILQDRYVLNRRTPSPHGGWLEWPDVAPTLGQQD